MGSLLIVYGHKCFCCKLRDSFILIVPGLLLAITSMFILSPQATKAYRKRGYIRLAASHQWASTGIHLMASSLQCFYQ